MGKIRVKIVLPWWTAIYIKALNSFALWHGFQPDAEKCARLITRYARVEIE